MDHLDQPETTPEPDAERVDMPAGEAHDTPPRQHRPPAHTPPTPPSRQGWQRWRLGRWLGASPSGWSRLLPPIAALGVVAAIVVGLVVVVQSAHSLPTTHTSTSGGGAGGTPTGTHTVSGGQPVAPDFILPTLGGAPFHLASQRGHVVVLYFMSTTCATCVQGTYFVAVAMQEAHVPGARAIAIDMNPGDTAADVVAFAHTTGVPANAPLLWAVDTQLTVSGSYGVLVLGTVYVVDGQGHIVYESDGSVALGPLVHAMQSYA